MAAQAHQDAVQVVSSHISGRTGEQRPRLALVVRDEALHLTVYLFVGQIHAVYALDLRKKTSAIVIFFFLPGGLCPGRIGSNRNGGSSILDHKH